MPARKSFKNTPHRGSGPIVACINLATVDLGVDFDRLIRALQRFVDECFAPTWGAPAGLVKAKEPVADAWTMVFLDEPDAPDALGYHYLTKNGLPLAKVFVKPTLAINEKVSVTACHELAEMLIDPAINLWSNGPKGVMYAFEMCDAVEEEEFLIDGIAMSDFVYPAYFDLFRKRNSAQFDHLHKVKQPFQILKRGYSLVRKGQKVEQIFGSKQKEKAFRKEDRTQHRTQYRKALLKMKPQNSEKLEAAPVGGPRPGAMLPPVGGKRPRARASDSVGGNRPGARTPRPPGRNRPRTRTARPIGGNRPGQ
jgi:hypothetical protein